MLGAEELRGGRAARARRGRAALAGDRHRRLRAPSPRAYADDVRAAGGEVRLGAAVGQAGRVTVRTRASARRATRREGGPRAARRRAIVCAGALVGPARAARRRARGPAHPAVPRRLPAAAPRAARPRARPDLPGARPEPAVPRGPPHAHDRRRGARRPDRAARRRARRLPAAPDPRRATCSTRWPGRARGGWRRAGGGPASPSCATRRSRAAIAPGPPRPTCPRSGREDLSTARPASARRPSARDGDARRRLRGLDRPRATLHVRNAPSPAATSSLALAELIADRAEELSPTR